MSWTEIALLWCSLSFVLLVFVKIRKQWETAEDIVTIVARTDGMADPNEAKAYFEKKLGPKRSSKRGENLTDLEIFYQRWRLSRNLPACIDCEIGDLVAGPCGGVSQNVYCDNALCGSKFNLVIDNTCEIERISDRSPNKPNLSSPYR